MRKEFHYNYSDAQAAAEAFAKENNGYVASEREADERTMAGCSYMDEQADNLCWSGSVSAIPVEDENGNEIGLFAYWE